MVDNLQTFSSILHPGNKKSNTNKTTVKWNTLCPDFHEQFVYISSITELPKQSLHITVWDKVKGKSDEYMGKSRSKLLLSMLKLVDVQLPKSGSSPKGGGVMDKGLAYCAGGQGLIPESPSNACQK